MDLDTVQGHTVLRCSGRISYREEATQFSSRVAEVAPHARQLIVDLSGVEIIDSAGLGELASVLLGSQAAGCAVKLAAPRPNVLEALQLTNLASVFEIYPTLSEAICASRPA
jgi:anti-sigma B factor antagonist